jgi:hypothetical protein
MIYECLKNMYIFLLLWILYFIYLFYVNNDFLLNIYGIELMSIVKLMVDSTRV